MKPVFSTTVLALNRDDVLGFLKEHEVHEFWEKYLVEFPIYLVQNGSLNKILLHKQVMQKLNEKVNFVNTYIDQQTTMTSSGNENHTEIVVAWHSSVYSYTKEFTVGSHLQIANITTPRHGYSERGQNWPPSLDSYS